VTTWCTEPLGNVLQQIKTGSTPRTSHPEYFNGKIPWFTPSDIGKTKHLTESSRTISEDGVNNGGAKLFSEDTVLLTCIGEIGRVGILRQRSSANQQITALIFNEAVLPDYAYYWFIANRHQLQRFANEAIVPILNNERLQEIPFSFPEDKDEQARIVAELDKSDSLVRTRRYALELNAAFLPATFVELFGDPVRNSQGWSVRELEELATVERGKFTPRPRNDPSYFGGPFPFIQTGDISRSGGRLRSWTQTLNDKGVKVSRRFAPGTVAIAIVGATIGMTAILEIDVYCPDSVVGIQVDEMAGTKEYIEFLLRFWRPVFLAQAPETARANINLDTLRPLRIPVPPLPLQQKFSALVGRAEGLRAVQHEALRQAEHLFTSLLHRAFSG
jgi:type I restriction enzyme S subunit